MEARRESQLKPQQAEVKTMLKEEEAKAQSSSYVVEAPSSDEEAVPGDVTTTLGIAEERPCAQRANLVALATIRSTQDYQIQ
ncbi:hypothetical protein QFC20_000249 [Naganishia adeliensis]|uniref:Uncharacterized protein n=1 Tax=Naganishia adeliensis TaxID=92952 RepID=A0ACC2X1S1_9TREE|nr:hypothetical protein QFC20_000249 [Naganishia adeliensis]